MSTCISQHGEYSEHDLPGTKFSEFDCNRCYAFAEDAALAEVERLRSKVARVEALAANPYYAQVLVSGKAESTNGTPLVFVSDLLAALAEPERDEEGS